MRKGQRPSRHYRRIKTKKGKKRILINPKIKRRKKIKIRRRRDSPMSDNEFERLYKQNEEMRLTDLFKESKSNESELEKLNAEIKEQDKEEKEQEQEEWRQEQKLFESNKKRKWDQRDAKKKLRELSGYTNKKGKFIPGILGELASKRLDRTRAEVLTKDFSKTKEAKTIQVKLTEARELARKSGDENLIDHANKLQEYLNEMINAKFSKEVDVTTGVHKPLKAKKGLLVKGSSNLFTRVERERVAKAVADGTATQAERAAFKLQTSPAVTTSEGTFEYGDPNNRGLKQKFLGKDVTHYTNEQWKQITADKIKSIVDQEERILSHKTLSAKERVDSIRRLEQAPKKIQRELLTDYDMSPKQRIKLENEVLRQAKVLDELRKKVEKGRNK